MAASAVCAVTSIPVHAASHGDDVVLECKIDYRTSYSTSGKDDEFHRLVRVYRVNLDARSYCSDFCARMVEVSSDGVLVLSYSEDERNYWKKAISLSDGRYYHLDRFMGSIETVTGVGTGMCKRIAGRNEVGDGDQT